MDFLQGIGERYLLSKANAVPHQLENLVKKQLQGPPKPAQQNLGPAETAKDQEIARLKGQLQASKEAAEKESQAAAIRPVDTKRENKTLKKEVEKSEKARSQPSQQPQTSRKEVVKGEDSKVKEEKVKDALHYRSRGRSLSSRTAIGTPNGRRSISAAASKLSPSHNEHLKEKEKEISKSVARSNHLASRGKRPCEISTNGSQVSSLTSENLHKLDHVSSASTTNYQLPPAPLQPKRQQPYKSQSAAAPERGFYSITVEEEEEASQVRTRTKGSRKDIVEVTSDRGRVLYRY
ncbi:MAG: hypothetical protein LQ351_000229 [Letrouitia transgressa]|nr:MAG: hypothetical protein LQ351_000229 [Letrouitia transgressa]